MRRRSVDGEGIKHAENPAREPIYGSYSLANHYERADLCRGSNGHLR